MNVALVSPYSWAHPGGVNNHIEGLAGQLVSRGHQVTVIAPEAAASDEGIVRVSAGRSLAIPANGSVARIALAPGTSSRVKKALASEEFDVVHVHEPMVPMVSTSAVMGAKGRVVATFHAAGEGRSSAYWLGKNLLRAVPRRIDKRIAVSEPARLLASRYLPGDYEIVPNGVDVSRFRTAAPHEQRWDSPEILFVGRDEPRKGLEVLLEAFRQVCDRVEGCRLKVIGSGLTLEGVIRELPLELQDRVTVPGFVPNADLPGHYAGADVFCAPALGGESFGIVLIEAMASGTPVVASDIPGYSAVMDQAGGGVLFKRGDATDLARVLVEVLNDSGLREQLASVGLDGVEQFSWEVLTPRLEEIYTD